MGDGSWLSSAASSDYLDFILDWFWFFAALSTYSDSAAAVLFFGVPVRMGA
jgi:hypothetical protein